MNKNNLFLYEKCPEIIVIVLENDNTCISSGLRLFELKVLIIKTKYIIISLFRFVLK